MDQPPSDPTTGNFSEWVQERDTSGGITSNSSASPISESFLPEMAMQAIKQGPQLTATQVKGFLELPPTPSTSFPPVSTTTLHSANISRLRSSGTRSASYLPLLSILALATTAAGTAVGVQVRRRRASEELKRKLKKKRLDLNLSSSDKLPERFEPNLITLETSPSLQVPPCTPARPASLSFSTVSPSRLSCTPSSSSLRQRWPIGSLPHAIRSTLQIVADEKYEVDRWRILPGKKLGTRSSLHEMSNLS